MRASIEYISNENIYWIRVNNETSDINIAEELNMPLRELSKTLIRQYNAYYDYIGNVKQGLFFESLEDVVKAFEYIQGVILSKKLADTNN